MSLQACADIVQRGDPDRFAATMAAPVAAREVLFPIYALNVEVARAPWVASEPMIGEMRLQWWRDALEEIVLGGQVRRHEVTTPLSDVLDAESAKMLDRLVQARRWDLYSEPFEDEGHFEDYLEATGGTLMWVAARALGGKDEAVFRHLGRLSGLANFLLAVPDLEAHGRSPLPEAGAPAIRMLAGRALGEVMRLQVPKQGAAAAIAAWRARTLLARAQSDPARVQRGDLAESEFRRRWTLFLAGLRV